jgi:hypothetical protein
MLVKELIEFLQKQNQEGKIWIYHSDKMCSITKVEHISEATLISFGEHSDMKTWKEIGFNKAVRALDAKNAHLHNESMSEFYAMWLREQKQNILK